MNLEDSVIVLDDDDDDVVEIVDGSHDNDHEEPTSTAKTSEDPTSTAKTSEDPTSTAKTSEDPTSTAKTSNKSSRQISVNGYHRPSYSYPQLITQALAVCPDRRASALEICDLIKNRQPFFKFFTGNWKEAIYSALTKRKKLFKIVDTNSNGEYIWTFNPTFEKYILDKWVPKYLKKNCVLTSVECPVIVSTESALPQQPVIVSTHSLRVDSDGADETVPEFTLDSPEQGSNQEVNPWEPEVTVSESNESGSSQQPVIVSTHSLSKDSGGILIQNEPEFTLANPEQGFNQEVNPWEAEVTSPLAERSPVNLEKAKEVADIILNTSKLKDVNIPRKAVRSSDFTLENLKPNHTVTKEEITYRVNFHADHPMVHKFRLHCTVCDTHLGTAGQDLWTNTRFHFHLGVLTCYPCFHATYTRYISLSACPWCLQQTRLDFSCTSCSYKFCMACVKRNFGQLWVNRISQKRASWQCFLCDSKQIWPHRAIAYFLFRHYRELRRRRKSMLSNAGKPPPNEYTFFTKDDSVCCKKLPDTESGRPASGPQPPLLFPHQLVPTPAHAPFLQQLLNDKEQPNHIYLQTSSPVPSVTLNTGTQYIHNVYPDKNYVLLQPSVQNISVPGEYPSSSNLITHMYPPKDVSGAPAVIPQMSVQSSLNVPGYPQKPPVLQTRLPPERDPLSPVSTVTVSMGDSATSADTGVSHSGKPSFQLKPTHSLIDASKFVSNVQVIPGGGVMSTTTRVDDSSTMIVPDNGQPDLFATKKLDSSPKELTAKERIERRPMPKSKKQSLLRTVLMNESIESMKRHFQQSQDIQAAPENITITPNLEDADLSIISNSSISSKNQSNHADAEQNVEEPILKSIIQTATERLLGLKKTQGSSDISIVSNTSSDKPSAKNVTSDIRNDSGSTPGVDEKTVPKESVNAVHFPKIKIKTLRELQEPVYLEEPKQICLKKVETVEEIVISNKEPDSEPIPTASIVPNIALPKEINVTGLKRGIIEASRTLVNTQKKLKELAKVISSNLSYKNEQAVELVSKFQDILKSCRRQIDTIDKNIKNQFDYLRPQTNIDPIKKSSENLINNGSEIQKKKIKLTKSRIHKERKRSFSDDNLSVKEESTGSCDSFKVFIPDNDGVSDCGENHNGTAKRKRDLVDFNPLGKTILGTPEVTQEDLQNVPMTWEPSLGDSPTAVDEDVNSSESVLNDLLRRKRLLKNKYRKRSMWDSKRRKRNNHNKHTLLQYNKDGSVRKKIGRRPYKDSKSEESNTQGAMNTPSRIRGTSLRMITKTPGRPLRSSERKHPSTAAYAASFLASDSLKTVCFPVNFVIKPCSVVLHRLDARFVHLLTKRFMDL